MSRRSSHERAGNYNAGRARDCGSQRKGLMTQPNFKAKEGFLEVVIAIVRLHARIGIRQVNRSLGKSVPDKSLM